MTDMLCRWLAAEETELLSMVKEISTVISKNDGNSDNSGRNIKKFGNFS